MDSIEQIQKRLLELDPLAIWEKHPNLPHYVMVIMHWDGRIFGMAIQEDCYYHWAAVEAAARRLLTNDYSH